MQGEWMRGDVQLITATIAFGMGVDKGEVRCVVHWGPPSSISAYAQESGRAGRDGEKAYARIFYSARDRDVILGLLYNDNKSNLVNEFKRVIRFCEAGEDCRHKVITDFFGDSEPACVNMCDICKNKDIVRNKLHMFLNGDTNLALSHRHANLELANVIKNKFYMKK